MEMDNDHEQEVAQLKLENMTLKEENQRLMQRIKESEHKEKEKTQGNDVKEKATPKKGKKARKRKSSASTKTTVTVTSVDAHHPLPKERVLRKQKSIGRLKEAKVVNDGVKKFEELINEQHYGGESRDPKDAQNLEVTDPTESSNNDSNE